MAKCDIKRQNKAQKRGDWGKTTRKLWYELKKQLDHNLDIAVIVIVEVIHDQGRISGDIKSIPRQASKCPGHS